MKKVILLFTLLFVSYATSAQFTLVNSTSGNTVNDGDVITVSTDNIETFFVLTNNYSTNINIKLEVVNIINTDGSEMKPCFGVGGHGNCYFSTSVGAVYDGGAPLAPSASTNSADIGFTHVDNTANNTYPKDYVFKISALNADHGDAFLSSITFTYRYDLNAVISPLSKDDFTIYAIGNHSMHVNTKNDVQLTFYSLTGKIAKQYFLKQGNHNIKTDMPTGIYVVYAKSGSSEIYTKLIVK